MSAMSTMLTAVRPPAPTPWRARHAMRVPLLCARPARPAETTVRTSESWTMTLRSNRSATLPQMGVLIVVVSSVAVTTHV